MRNIKSVIFCFTLISLLFNWGVPSAFAIGAENILRAEQAFKVSAKMLTSERVELSFDISDGYYLYRDKISSVSQSPAVQIGKLELPEGVSKHDENFGDVVIYRNKLLINAPVTYVEKTQRFSIQIKYQGCADVGVCYPPQKSVLELQVPEVTNTVKTDSDSQAGNAANFLKKLSSGSFTDELLPAEQAFQLFVNIKDEQTLQLNWLIAERYYLYREKIRLSLIDSSGVSLGNYEIPHGKPQHDEAFGQVEIFYQDLNFDLPLIRTTQDPQNISLVVAYQGCAERGVCYPPIQKTVQLALPAMTKIGSANAALADNPLSEQDQIIRALHHDKLWLTWLSFFGFGLLLAFTPCIFPMIPILSGIIVGKGRPVTSLTAFLLSLSYVLAGAVTYTLFGILAALFGSNLQATFQQPWIIATFSGVFVLLALSMFGFYHLELPKAFQAHLHNSSDKFRNGSYWGAAIMGALSSLIVGPCVAAPLAAALIYIGQTGDVLLGGSALFMLGLGMGVPLLIIGTSAGKLLPKAGHWLTVTKAVFGVIMLAMAAWMLERILPDGISMLLWAMLLIIPAIYLRALDPLPEVSSNWQRFWKGIGIIMLIYGVLLMVGLSAGNANPLKPLQGLGVKNSAETQPGLVFKPVRSNAELDAALQQAGTNNQTVMLDFYADWCISCNEMETYTFTDPAVQQRLKGMLLVRADITRNSDEDQALLKRFNLIGPPAILFFDKNKLEQTAYRVIGFQESKRFLSSIRNVQ